MSKNLIIDGNACVRVPFAAVQVGDALYRADQGIIGNVIAVEKYPNCNRNSAVTLDNGRRLTYRGWASKRIWRAE